MRGSFSTCQPKEIAYSSFAKGIIRSISENGPRFTFDEYRVILGLIHDIKKETDGEGESPNSNYSAWLLKLDDVMAKYEI